MVFSLIWSLVASYVRSIDWLVFRNEKYVKLESCDQHKIAQDIWTGGILQLKYLITPTQSSILGCQLFVGRTDVHLGHSVVLYPNQNDT